MQTTTYPIISSLLALFLAQLIKPFYYYFKTKKFDWKYINSSGGFPSSHSAAVSALSLSIGLVDKFNSPIFAVTLIFSIIVIYDAVNVRYYAGRNIQLTKQLIEDIESELNIKLDKTIYKEKIKTILGHRHVEAVGGIVLGCIIAFILYGIML